jgi:hypothetical protein
MPNQPPEIIVLRTRRNLNGKRCGKLGMMVRPPSGGQGNGYTGSPVANGCRWRPRQMGLSALSLGNQQTCIFHPLAAAGECVLASLRSTDRCCFFRCLMLGYSGGGNILNNLQNLAVLRESRIQNELKIKTKAMATHSEKSVVRSQESA